MIVGALGVGWQRFARRTLLLAHLGPILQDLQVS
jgi:hypothetical protein